METIAGHIKVCRFFLQPQTRSLLNHLPHILNKYFVKYLASSFEKTLRRKILLHHYGFIAARLADDFYDLILNRRYILWQMRNVLGLSTISLAVSDHHQEGDLSLLFLVENVEVFVISFSIVKGELVGCPGREVLLIARVQGVKHQREAIRQGTKSCHDIAPSLMLMAALQGVAQTLGIDTVAGVGNLEQLIRAGKGRKEFGFDYNDYWEKLLAVPSGSGFYVMPVPLLQKPLMDIVISHRRRTRRKRQFKADVTAVSARSFAQLMRET